MFERYTESARRAVFFARHEASQLGSASIETEHLLLGLTREGDRFIARLFSKSRLSMKQIRRDVESRSPSRGKASTSVEMPLSRESRRVLGHAAEEAERMRHDSIGTEHLLLGLMREEGSVAAGILTEMGLRVTVIREELVVRRNEMAAAGKGTDTPGSAEAAHERADTLHCDAPHGGDPQNGLFARFTERARRVIFFARYETSQLGGAAIETEHLLLGLMREGKGVTSRLFRNRQLSMERVRHDIEKRVSDHGRVSTSIDVPLSPETKRALGYAAHESAGMGHNYIGTEHLLLGLLCEKGGLAAVILAEKGVQLGRAREEILALLAGEDPSRADPAPRPPDVEKREAEPVPIELSELDRRFLRSLKITAD